MKTKLAIFLLTISFTFLFNNVRAQGVLLRRYYNSILQKHFYTTDFNELGNGKNGWVQEQPVGYLNSTGPASIAVYRFYNPTTSGHYYSLNSTPPSGFYYEKIIGYNITPGVLLGVPVYQYHHPQGDFFYTTSNVTPDGYTADGPVFNVSTTAF